MSKIQASNEVFSRIAKDLLYNERQYVRSSHEKKDKSKTNKKGTTIMMHSATPQPQLSALFKVLVFIALSLALTACGGGDGKSNSSALPKAIISGTIDSKVVTSASANSYLPQAQSSVTNQAVPITNDDLSGSIVVYATDTDGNSYQTQTDKDRKFSLSVPEGKSYVIMFVNGAGKFIGVFVHDTSLETAAYKISSNTNIGTISFTPEGKATSDKATEMSEKRDKEAVGLPKTIDEAKPPKNKISTRQFVALPEGSYSYYVRKNDHDHGDDNNFSHSVKYHSEAEFKGDKQLAILDFHLCGTDKSGDSCKASDNFHLNKINLKEVTKDKIVESHEIRDSVYTGPGHDFYIPRFLDMDKSKSYKGSFIDKDDGREKRINWAANFDSIQKKVFSGDGKVHEYLVIRVVWSEALGTDKGTFYQWYAKGFGKIAESPSIPTQKTIHPEDLMGNEENGDDDKAYRYVYNSSGAEYGKKPSFLTDSKVKELLALAKNQVSTIKYASASRYVPDGSEKITIDGTDYPVKRVSFYRWRDSNSDNTNIKFSPDDKDSHGNRLGEMQINLGDQGSSVEFRQKLIKAGPSGLEITGARINVYDLTYGWGVNGNENVTLTWKDDAKNTFTVSGLSVDAVAYEYDKNGSNQVVKKMPVTFGDLTVQWRSTEH